MAQSSQDRNPSPDLAEDNAFFSIALFTFPIHRQ